MLSMRMLSSIFASPEWTLRWLHHLREGLLPCTKHPVQPISSGLDSNVHSFGGIEQRWEGLCLDSERDLARGKCEAICLQEPDKSDSDLHDGKILPNAGPHALPKCVDAATLDSRSPCPVQKPFLHAS